MTMNPGKGVVRSVGRDTLYHVAALRKHPRAPGHGSGYGWLPRVGGLGFVLCLLFGSTAAFGQDFRDSWRKRPVRKGECQPLYPVFAEQTAPAYKPCGRCDPCRSGAAPVVIWSHVSESASVEEDENERAERIRNRRLAFEQAGLLTGPLAIPRRAGTTSPIPMVSMSPPAPSNGGAAPASSAFASSGDSANAVNTGDKRVATAPSAVVPSGAAEAVEGPGLDIISVEAMGPVAAVAGAADGFEAATGWSLTGWDDTGPVGFEWMQGGDFLRRRLSSAENGQAAAAAQVEFINAQLRVQSAANAAPPAKAALELTIPSAGDRRLPATARADLESVTAAANGRGGLGAVRLRATNAGAEPVLVAVALTIDGGDANGYYESQPEAVAPGSSRLLEWDAAARLWKSERSNWTHAVAPGRGRVQKIALLFYSSPGAGERPMDMWIDQLRLHTPPPPETGRGNSTPATTASAASAAAGSAGPLTDKDGERARGRGHERRRPVFSSMSAEYF